MVGHQVQDGNDHKPQRSHSCCCSLQHGRSWPERASSSCLQPPAAGADGVTLQLTFWMCCMRLGLSCPLESRLPDGLSWVPDLLRDPASCLFMDQLPELSTASALPRKLSSTTLALRRHLGDAQCTQEWHGESWPGEETQPCSPRACRPPRSCRHQLRQRTVSRAD